jgi:hypothetical protein
MGARTTTEAFFDPKTWTVSYVVWDHASRHAAVIDPVLDYDFDRATPVRRQPIECSLT